MQDRTHPPRQLLLTVGRSDRSLEEFVDLLQTPKTTLVADVRKMPGLGRNRQFGHDTFDDREHGGSLQVWLDRHRGWVLAGVGLGLGVALLSKDGGCAKGVNGA